MAHVTIPDQATWVEYAVTSSSTGPFVVPFAIFEKADLVVEVGGVELALSAFSYSQTSSTTGGYQTGTVTLGSAVSNTTIVIYRKILPVRTTDYGAGPLSRDAINSALDRVQAQLQDLRREASRSLALDFGDTPARITTAGTTGQVLTLDGSTPPKPVWADSDGGGVGGGNAETLNGQNGAYYLSRANHTGTQPWSTITGKPTDVASIAALRLLSTSTSASASVVVAVTNYIAGDGGGVFAHDSSDTTSADDGGVIIVDASGRRWKRLFSGAVNVRWFGARGDGSTNDRAAIQAAIEYWGPFSHLVAEGGVVYFPTRTNSGTTRYMVGSALTPRHGVTLIGDGPTAVEIAASGNWPVIDGSSYTVVEPLGKFNVANLTIRGGGRANASAHGVVIGAANNCAVDRVNFFGCRDALRLSHVWQTNLNDVFIHGDGTDKNYNGLVMLESTLTHIDNAVIASNVHAMSVENVGFRLINAQGSKFINCEAGGCGAYGWHIGAPGTGTVEVGWMHFTNCLGDSCGLDNWLFDRGSATALHDFHGSTIWSGNSGGAGIRIVNGTSITFQAVSIKKSDTHSIQLVGCNRVLITGDNDTWNDANGGHAAFVFQSCSNCLIESTRGAPIAGTPDYISYISDTQGTSFVRFGTPPETFDPYLLINGKFQIWQRGTSGVSSGYRADMWALGLSGPPAGTYAQSTDVPTARGLEYSANINVTTAYSGSGDFYLRNRVKQAALVVNKTVTISGWVKGPNGATSQIGINDNMTTVTHTGAWQYVTRSFTPPSAALGLYVDVIRAPTQTGNYYAAGWQIDVDVVPSPLRVSINTEELLRCQAYYCRIGQGAFGRWHSASVAHIAFNFPVVMHATPTVSLLSSAPQLEELSVAFRTGSGSTIGFSRVGTYGAHVAIDGFSGATAGNSCGAAAEFIQAEAAL